MRFAALSSGLMILSPSSIFLVNLGFVEFSITNPGESIPAGMKMCTEMECRSISDRRVSARPETSAMTIERVIMLESRNFKAEWSRRPPPTPWNSRKTRLGENADEEQFGVILKRGMGNCSLPRTRRKITKKSSEEEE